MKLVPTKDGRPQEADSFIKQILDEVNEPSRTTTWSSSRSEWDRYDSPAKGDQKSGYGADQVFASSSPRKVNPQTDYGYDYNHGVSPLKSEVPRDYGDRYDDQGNGLLGSGYEQPPRRDNGNPNEPWVKPKSQEDQFGVPNSKWGNISIRPQTPKAYDQDHNKQWVRSPDHVYDQPSQRDDDIPNEQWNYHRKKPYEAGDYRAPESDAVVKPRSMKDQFGVPNNRWDNTTVKPQSPKGYEDLKKQWVKSSSHLFDQPSRRDNGFPNEQWDNHRWKPDEVVDYRAPKKDSIIKAESMKDQFGVPSNRWDNTTAKPQSPKGYKDSNHQWKTTKSFLPEGYEDPNKQPVRSSDRVYDQPSQRDNGRPNEQWDNHRRKADEVVDYRAPKSDSLVKPQSMKDQFGVANRWENTTTKPQSPKGYEDPNSQWTTTKSPLSRGYEDPNKQWVRSFDRVYDQLSQTDIGIPNKQWDEHRRKPEEVVDYRVPQSDSIIKPQKDQFGVPNNKWDKPQSAKGFEDSNNHRINNATKSHPAKAYQDPSKQCGRSSDRVYDQPSQMDNNKPESLKEQFGVPNNKWDNSSVKNQPPKSFENPKSQWINTTAKSPVSKGYEDPNPQWDRSSSDRVYDQPPQRNHDVPQTELENRSKKPDVTTTYGAPRSDSTLKPESMKDPPGSCKSEWDNVILEPRSPMAYEGTKNQNGKFNPNYNQLKPKNNSKGVAINGWGNSPRKPQDSKIQESKSSNPVYDHQTPKGNSSYIKSQDNFSLNNPQSPKGNSPDMNSQPHKPYIDIDNRSSSPSSPKLSTNGSKFGAYNNKFGNSPLKSQPFKSYGAPGSQWEQPSSPISGPRSPRGEDGRIPNGNTRPQEQPNMAYSSNPTVPKDSYEHEPRVGDQTMFAAKTSPAEGAVVSYVKPAGLTNVRLRKYYDGDNHKSTITCKEAIEKYDGFMI